MARNGAGTYSLYTPGNPVVTGTTISSTAFNNTMNDIASALTQSLSADGQTPVTANIPMNSKKLTGLAVASTSGDALSYGNDATVANLTATGTMTGTSLTLSTQPRFQAGRTTSNQTITGTTTIVFNTEAFDIGSGYDNTTGIFTVPTGQGGTYLFCVQINLTAPVASDTAYVELNAGSVNYTNGYTASGSANVVSQITAVITLNAADTAFVRVIPTAQTWTTNRSPNAGASRGCIFSATRLC